MSPNTSTITRETARDHLVHAITRVAPDVADELATLQGDTDLFEEFGLDSMDRLGIMESLEAATGVSIPEEAYLRLTSVDAIVDHLCTDAPSA